ncbi:MAG: SH3-like domain-containing protein [Pseudomonadota bacterium]
MCETSTMLPHVDPLPFDPPYPAGNSRFTPGQTVRVLKGSAPGHVRTPWYLRGRAGVIERVCGAFANPEELAYNRDGLPERVLYRVRFSMDEVWGNGSTDTIDAEIFEHWLEAI